MGDILELPVRFRLKEVLDELEKAGEPMSQSELSRRSGVSMTTINAMVLNKTKQVSLATLEELCKALKREPGDLLTRKQLPSATPRKKSA